MALAGDGDVVEEIPTDTGRWKRLESIFEEALALDAERRNEFLDQACEGDLDMRREIQSLLDADRGQSGFLAPPGKEMLGIVKGRALAKLAVGKRLGPWRITGEIASGGMGVVYRAERADGQFEKEVAIKVIRRALHADDLLARFRVERQTLALLDHPNIARLLDGGATDDGLPFLVMEYVDGQPIDVYADERRLPTTERVKLFRLVCDAVHFAHQHLVVHRDLKPSNVLVDRKGEPKLLDFGIAKVLAPSESHPGGGDLTTTGARLMTPEYASPEQVRGESVTTATDVYSLGVVLYEMLSGHHPYRPKSTLAHELARAICEEDPERPSTAIRRVVERRDTSTGRLLPPITPQSVSEVRDGRPDRLRRRLAGDLDNVVLKAMHKDPSRRYASVQQLAEDLDRYLEGRPVLARRPTLGYRAVKFVRRNKVGTALAAATAISIVAAVAGIAQSAHVAREQKRRADEQADAASASARNARRVSNFLYRVIASANPEKRGHDVRVVDVLDEAAARLDSELAEDPQVEAEIRTTVGAAYRNVGAFDSALPQLEAALAVRRRLFGEAHPLTASSKVNLGDLLTMQSRFDEAQSLLESALEYFQSLPNPESAETAETLGLLARLHRERGDGLRSMAMLRDVIAMRRRIHGSDSLEVIQALDSLATTLLTDRSDYAEIESLLREAMEIAERLLPNDHVTIASVLGHLGDALRDQGKLEDAKGPITRALEIRRRRFSPGSTTLVPTLIGLGLVHSQQGNPALAEPLFREALDIQRRALGNDHPDIAATLNNLAGARKSQGDLEGAIAFYRESLALVERRLGVEHPNYAHAAANLGVALQASGQTDEAERMLAKSLELRLKRHGENHRDTATSLNNLAYLYQQKGDHERASPLYRRALAVRRATLPPTHPSLASVLMSLASNDAQLGRFEEVEPLLRECLRILETQAQLPTVRIAQTSSLLGHCLERLGRHEDAESVLRPAWETLERESGASDHATVEARLRLATTVESLGRADEADRLRDVRHR